MTYRIPLKGIDAEHYVEQYLEFQLDILNVFPKYFLIETINMCNARCIMCAIDFKKRKNPVMSDALFDKIANDLSQYKDHIEKVALYLDGEPLLDKGLPEKIQKLKKAGIKKINIATNASLLNKEKAIQIIDAGLDEIFIAIDSLKKEVYESIRVGLKFEKVYQNIMDFILTRNKLNPNLVIRIQMILQELNINEAGDFKKHWRPLLKSNDQVAVQKAHNYASGAKVMKFGDEKMVNNIPCIALWGTFVIHVSGIVPLCCMDTKSEVVLGDLNNQTIAEVWSGNILNKIRKIHLSGKRNKVSLCDGCTLWRDSKSKRDLTKINL